MVILEARNRFDGPRKTAVKTARIRCRDAVKAFAAVAGIRMPTALRRPGRVRIGSLVLRNLDWTMSATTTAAPVAFGEEIFEAFLSTRREAAWIQDRRRRAFATYLEKCDDALDPEEYKNHPPIYLDDKQGIMNTGYMELVDFPHFDWYAAG